jgi:ATP-dependent Clp protease ATP-binding subunit ClpB
VSPEALDWLAERGFDPAYGARPLRRTIQTELQDPIADLVLQQKLDAGKTVTVGRDETTAKLTFAVS